MSNWWDNGIKGNSMSNNFAVSTGLGRAMPDTTYTTLKIDNPSIIGSVPLKETLDTDTSTYLLLTTESGTQIYAIVNSTYSSETTQRYRPEEMVHIVYHNISFKLKKGGTELSFGTTYGLPSYIAGDPNPYNNKLRTGLSERLAVTYRFDDAYPAAKESAVSQLICVASNDGIDFYELGYEGTQRVNDTPYHATPVRYVGRIPASALNNDFWFEPDEDFLTPQEADQSGTGSGRGEGVYDYPGEDVGFPTLPTVSVLGIGNYKMFNPTGAQLGDVIDGLWFSGGITELIELFKRFLFKPKESLVSITMMPFNVASSASTSRVYLGNFDTGVDAPIITQQFQTIDCGSINVPLKYASVLDYSPYQKATLFLPFVGFRNINVDQIAGGTIAIKYNVDVLTGAAVCFVRITDGHNSNNSVLYNFDCNIGVQVPVSSDKYDAMISGILSVGSRIASASIGAGAIGGSIAKAAGAGAVSSIPSAMETISASHGIDASGQLSSTAGVLGEFTPYLVLEQVNQSLPAGYNSHEGYPSNITSQLGSLTGYTEVEKIHLNIPEASSIELTEIEQLLTHGVIL